MNKIYRYILRTIDETLGLRRFSYPYISGDSFRALAQHVYGDPKTNLDPRNVKKGDVIFVKGDKVAEFMRNVHPNIIKRYVILTHNSDSIIDESWIPFIEDPKIIRWFGQNAMIEHPKLIPLPIGLENLHWHVNGEVSLFKKAIKKNMANSVAKKLRVLYAFNIGTNPAERQPAFDALSKNPLADSMEKVRGKKGWPSPSEYVKVLNSYAAVASPPGNGTDCHRTWEAVYLDVMPIVKRSPAMEYFRSIGLPLCIVDTWSTVPAGENALKTSYDTAWSQGSLDALWMDYWMEKIENARHDI